MIAHKGYSVEQYVNSNRIVITLPQTIRTITNTTTPIHDRRDELSREELAAILCAVIELFEGEAE